MLHTGMTAAFKNIAKAHKVGLNVRKRVFKAVAYPGLGRQVYYMGKGVVAEQRLHGRGICHVHVLKGKIGKGAQQGKAAFLQGRGVIVVEGVNAHNGVPFLQQAAGKVKANKTSGTSNKHMHTINLW